MSRSNPAAPEPRWDSMSGRQNSPWRGRRFLPGLLIFGFAICNFVTPLIAEFEANSSRIYVVAWVGLVGSAAGQFCLLAIWGVLGPFRSPARLITTLAIGVFLLASLDGGFRFLESRGGTARIEVSSYWFIPLTLLAFQLPLWGLKLISGGRIAHVGTYDHQSMAPPRQFGIRDVMGATVVIAVALSLASSGLRISDGQSTNWSSTLTFCLACAVLSTFASLPCLWAGMIARRKGLATAIVAIYTVLIPVLCVVVVGLLSAGQPVPVQLSMMPFVVCGTLMAVILGSLHVARLSGYIYVSQRRPKPTLATDCPSVGGDESPGDEAES